MKMFINEMQKINVYLERFSGQWQPETSPNQYFLFIYNSLD